MRTEVSSREGHSGEGTLFTKGVSPDQVYEARGFSLANAHGGASTMLRAYMAPRKLEYELGMGILGRKTANRGSAVWIDCSVFLFKDARDHQTLPPQ